MTDYAYNPNSPHADEFINHAEILESLKFAHAHKDDLDLCRKILKKCQPHLHPAKEHGTLIDHREASVLLACSHPEINAEIKRLARAIKRAYYGNRIVLFAPLYLSNYCINGCVYCPYNSKNHAIPRHRLTQDEIRSEVMALQDMGHKRLALETGEDPKNNPIDYLLESIDTIYSTKHKNGAIRRVNVNIAATTGENYRLLKDRKIGTYILFQETYHKASYQSLHTSGPKHDYNYHTEAHDRAMEAGIDDVGLGVLFGLDDFTYEFCGLIMHAEHLEARYGIGPHTISVPRIKPAPSIDMGRFRKDLSDEFFEKLIALIRITVPYTGIIISTRENEAVRTAALECGVSQISGGSLTSVGGYTRDVSARETEQFAISDERTLDEIVQWLFNCDHIPSFCTACYRSGRTGDRFMEFCKTGQIANFCHPNALLTLAEYLSDYASLQTAKRGWDLIEHELKKIDNPNTQKLCKEYIDRIRTNEQRDYYF